MTFDHEEILYIFILYTFHSDEAITNTPLPPCLDTQIQMTSHNRGG